VPTAALPASGFWPPLRPDDPRSPLLICPRRSETMQHSSDLFSAVSATLTDRPVATPDRATFEAHLARRRYGRFTLTEAVRPAWQLGIIPEAGYRRDIYSDPTSGGRLPALVAAISSERLFETFLQLLEPLGDTCDVIIDSSHDRKAPPAELARHGIERVLLESLLWDFEDLLLNDGCSGIAVMHPDWPLEVQLDEHKLLVVYASDLSPFEQILIRQGVPRNDGLRVISQGDHMHTSHGRYSRRFAELAGRLHAE
jgi:hypothetical protein